LLHHNDTLVFYDLGLNLLVRIGHQGAFALGLRAHSLNGVHHIALLRKEGVA